MKTWQSMMKHAEECKATQLISCHVCPHNSLHPNCPPRCPKGECTCQRDGFVTAIDGVVEAAEMVREHMYKSNPTDLITTTDILKAALDRLNALTGDGREDGEAAE